MRWERRAGAGRLKERADGGASLEERARCQVRGERRSCEVRGAVFFFFTVDGVELDGLGKEVDPLQSEGRAFSALVSGHIYRSTRTPI